MQEELSISYSGFIHYWHFYYPFGMNFDGVNPSTTSKENRYQYNGKELEKDYGIDLSDYGARWYDAAIGRFVGVDPIANHLASLSAYNYGSDNPIGNIDLYGLQGVDHNDSDSFIDDWFDNGFFQAITNYFSPFNKGTEAPEARVAKAVIKYNEIQEEIVEGAHSVGVTGALVETVGDVEVVGGGVIALVDPPLGAGVIEMGIWTSGAGVTMQVIEHSITNDKNELAKIGVRKLIPRMVSFPLQKGLKVMDLTIPDREIIDGTIKTVEVIIEQGVQSVPQNYWESNTTKPPEFQF